MKPQRSLLILLIAIAQVSNLFAQDATFYRLYNYAKATPESIEENIDVLANHLKVVAKNDKEAVEIIYYWIALNIDYDVAAYQSEQYGIITAESTLLTKKSVCQGYAELFAALCKAVDIECEVVSGYAKGFGYYGGRIPEANHAWNAVKVNNEWKLIDVTWGSGSVDSEGEDLVYIPLLSLRYLFPDPKEYIVDHLPEDPKWQLLKEPITEDIFYSDDFEIIRLNRRFNAPKN
jgi:transglutaminase/protease-like cytokinesis protein 3